MVIACALVACAQVRSVSGGEKDVEAPVVLFSDPPFLSTNINPKKITLTFDEYIQLNSIQQELVVSPPLPHQPIVKVKSKNVILSFEDSLLANTTYQINFGDGIVDVNENNKAKDLIYVFSTGDQIDSLTYSGKVHQYESDEPGKNMKVLLFANDSAIFTKKSLPLYFARSKEDGSFRLSYLNSGTYFLYALDDVNGNYTWDDGEAIAIHGAAVNIQPGDSITDVLAASIPRSSKPSVKEYITDSLGGVKIVVDPYYHDLQITSLSERKFVKAIVGDTVQIWLHDSIANDEEMFRIQWNSIIDDTISVRKYQEAIVGNFSIAADCKEKILASKDVVLSASIPISIADQERFQFQCDSVSQPFELLLGDSPNTIRIRSKTLVGKKYDIHLLPGAVRSMYGATNDSAEFHFSCYKTEDLGTLQIGLHGLTENVTHIFKLYNKSREVIFKKTVFQDENITVTDLPAGEYSAEVLRDDNDNGVYDPIDLASRVGPERIFIYTGKISVRANWEVKTDWNFVK